MSRECPTYDEQVVGDLIDYHPQWTTVKSEAQLTLNRMQAWACQQALRDNSSSGAAPSAPVRDAVPKASFSTACGRERAAPTEPTA